MLLPGIYTKSPTSCDWAGMIFIVVAERTGIHTIYTTRKLFPNLALVKKILGSNVEDKLRKIQHIQDASIVSLIEIFRSDRACYVVYEYLSYSLYYVTGSPRLDEIRLAAIVGQVRQLSLLPLVRLLTATDTYWVSLP
jgi:hypothetical protein